MPPSPPSTYELAVALGRRAATGVLRATLSAGEVQIFLLAGRLLWATSTDPRSSLGAAFVAAGLMDPSELPSLKAEARTDDDLISALVKRGRDRDRLEAVRREVLRGRVRMALAEGEDARFDEVPGSLDGIDPTLLPDLDLLAIGQDARRAVEAQQVSGPAPDSPHGIAAHQLLERYHARHSDSWYDLLGVRPSVSPASLQRAADQRIAAWSAVADHPGVGGDLRRKAGRMVQAVQLAAERLVPESDRDAYDQLLQRGGAPRVADLIAEAEAPLHGFAPTMETDPTPAPPRQKGFLARLFGGGGR